MDLAALPHSVDGEQCTLGSILIEPEAIDAVADFLRPEHFYTPVNQTTYRAMLALKARGVPCDYTMVSDELDRIDRNPPEAWFVHLSRLCNAVPTSVNVEYYARLVERTAIMRDLIKAGGKLAALGYSDTVEVPDALAKADAIVRELTGAHSPKDGPQTIGPVVTEYLHQIEGNIDEATGEIAELKPRAATGFTGLDNLIGGFQRSDLVIVAARPSHGKTALALSLLRNASVQGDAVTLLFSVEMSRWQIAGRMLSMEALCDGTRLRNGTPWPSESQSLEIAEEALSAALIYVDDTPSIRLGDLLGKARRLAATTQPSLIVVDYLQLVRAQEGGMNRVQEIGAISRALKGLARELDTTVIALSQLSRAVEGRPSKVPVLADLRDSGDIEQDADMVLMLYRAGQYDAMLANQGTTEVHVRKNRNGPTGSCKLFFNQNYTRFFDEGSYP